MPVLRAPGSISQTGAVGQRRGKAGKDARDMLPPKRLELMREQHGHGGVTRPPRDSSHLIIKNATAPLPASGMGAPILALATGLALALPGGATAQVLSALNRCALPADELRIAGDRGSGLANLETANPGPHVAHIQWCQQQLPVTQRSGSPAVGVPTGGRRLKRRSAASVH